MLLFLLVQLPMLSNLIDQCRSNILPQQESQDCSVVYTILFNMLNIQSLHVMTSHILKLLYFISQASSIIALCVVSVVFRSQACVGSASSAVTTTFAPSATCLASMNWIMNLTAWTLPGTCFASYVRCIHVVLLCMYGPSKGHHCVVMHVLSVTISHHPSYKTENYINDRNLQSLRLRVRVPTRASSKKKEARGIYQHAEVIPGWDWVSSSLGQGRVLELKVTL